MSQSYNQTSIRCEQFDQPLSQSMFDRFQKWESEMLLRMCNSIIVDPMTRFLKESPKGFKLIDHPRQTVLMKVVAQARIKKKYTKGGF